MSQKFIAENTLAQISNVRVLLGPAYIGLLLIAHG